MLASPPERFRCSAASRERDESLSATASPVSSYLLLEEPGAWGPEVLQCHRLPDELRAQAAKWQTELGLRPQLIRRPGRSSPNQRRIFVVNTHHHWAQTALVDDLAQVVGWDLAQVGSAGGVGLQPWTEPLLLACTHGRHDACCAERGRPVAAALAAEFGDAVWESSHLGGDRFAANLLILPDAHTYGRLDPETAVPVVRRHLAGQITPALHRGRNSVSWVAQAAEEAVRERLGQWGVDAVTSRLRRRDESSALVEVRVGETSHQVEVQIGRAAAAPLTCTSAQPSRAPTYTILG